MIERYAATSRRQFLQSATGLAVVLSMPFARISAATVRAQPDSERIAIVDTRFDAALKAASRLQADVYLSMGPRPDAYRIWRYSLQRNRFNRVCGVTTLSDYALLRDCLQRTGYRLSNEKLIKGPATLVNWTLSQ